MPIFNVLAGVVTHYNFRKAFGYIEAPNESGKSENFYISSTHIAKNFKSLRVGSNVRFNPAPATRPGHCRIALNIEVESRKEQKEAAAKVVF